MKKRIASLILVMALSLSLTGCTLGRILGRIIYEAAQQDSYQGGAAVEGADIQIQRPRRATEVHMGEEGTWTVFIYLCGSDLETDGGYATANLEELQEATYGSKVTFVVQTGGADRWQNNKVDEHKTQRYVISDGKMICVDSLPKANMGKSSTLYSFLSWGVENYPSYYMGVILWNHGGGSQAGICYDEMYDYDYLTLDELDEALGQVYTEMTCNFELIGMDACLMATVETANVCANYCNYMVASQEYEPGAGWDYSQLALDLQKDPYMNGAAIGTEICKDYYTKCRRWGDDDYCTLSVIDLSKLDPLIYAFDLAAKELADNSGDSAFMAETARAAAGSVHFGGNSRQEGYSNLVDLGDFMTNIRNLIGAPADEVVSALQQAVVYTTDDRNHIGAGGLSLFYPYHAENWELQQMGRVSVSSHYLTYIDSAAHSGGGSGVDQYIGGYFSQGGTNSGWDAYWDQYGNGSSDDLDFYQDHQNGQIQIQQGPALDENGIYHLWVAKESLPYLDHVSFTLFADLGDGTFMDIGTDNDVFVNWDTGLVEDNFTGKWACLPDEQILPITLIEITDQYNLYTTPVLYNGEETNLRIKWVWDDPYDPDNSYGTYQVVGIWSGVEEDGKTNRQIHPIRKGDTIAPLYYRYKEGGALVGTVAGDPYTVGSKLTIDVTTLPEGDYQYAFCLTDVYQNQLLTDFTVFYVDQNGELYYYED